MELALDLARATGLCSLALACFRSWFSDARVLDLWGLASIEVLQSVRSGAYSTQEIARLCARGNVQIAVVYTPWYDRYGGLPAEWIKVGTWTIADNVVCGGDEVAFYALSPRQARRLAANLQSFSAHLPWTVTSRLLIPTGLAARSR
jgi:hypothetical protein